MPQPCSRYRGALGMLPPAESGWSFKMFHRPPSPHIHSLTPALLSYGLPATLSHPIVALSLSGPGFPGHHPSGVSWQKGLPSTQPLPPTPAGPPPGLESDWVL